MTKDDKNESRQPPKEAKPVDFAERLASLSDGQLKKLSDLIKTEIKNRDSKASVIGQMSDSEFNALKDELTSKAEREKKNG